MFSLNDLFPYKDAKLLSETVETHEISALAPSLVPGQVRV